MSADPSINIDPMELADIGQPVKLAQEIHRQLRNQLVEVPRRIPLAGIAESVGVAGFKEFDTDRFEGTLVIEDGYGAIGLRKGLRSGRRNFTIGHELGHFLIPTHRLLKTRFECAKRDLAVGNTNGQSSRLSPDHIEAEANEFSAALLVPVPEYQKERHCLGSGCDVAHIRQLAEIFDVSQEMMANIYVNSSDEKIAIVTSHRGLVRRIMIPKGGFPYLGLRRDSPLPGNSLTRTFNPPPGQPQISELCEVATHTWLERKGRVSSLYEQVFVQEDGWSMTLLNVDEEQIDEDEDDRNWNRRSSRH